METFFCDEDYEEYIDLMAQACRQSNTDVWAYCLMPNHVHLVMAPKAEDGLRAALEEAHRRYTRYINFREKWRGHLWQERFHSFPMDEQYLYHVVRYIERNPVAAKLCERPEQWRWSSAEPHLKGEDDQLVTVTPMLERISDWNAYLSEGDDEALIAQCSRTYAQEDHWVMMILWISLKSYWGVLFGQRNLVQNQLIDKYTVS